KYSPNTVVWAAGGTRRQAVLEDIPIGREYYLWSFKKQFEIAELFLRTGVKTLFMPVMGPPQIKEVGDYADKLLGALSFICNDETFDFYKKMNARVRFYGHKNIANRFNNQEF